MLLPRVQCGWYRRQYLPDMGDGLGRFTSGDYYNGWTASTTFSCYGGFSSTAHPICPSSMYGSAFYIVVICKNAVSACQLSLSLGVRQIAPTSLTCPDTKMSVGVIIMAVVGFLAVVVCVILGLRSLVMRCKEKRVLCYALACCHPSTEQEPFQSLPLDDLSTSQNQDSDQI